MRIHHLNCISACPIGGMLMDGVTTSSLRARLATHCLLLETSSGLILIDTGYGLRDVADPRSRLAKPFLAMLKPQLREEMTAVRQIERLKDRRSRLANQRRLRELKVEHSAEVTIFCAHDVREFEQLSGRSHHVPLAAERSVTSLRVEPVV